MCVAFTGTAILDYVFSSQEEHSLFKCVYRDELDAFCRKLEEEIVAHCYDNPHYKYVYFDFDEWTLSEFLAEYTERYLETSEAIYALESMDGLNARVLACYNDDVVTNAMNTAFDATFKYSDRSAA